MASLRSSSRTGHAAQAKSGHMFVLTASLEEIEIQSRHKTSKQAATAAWDFCESNDLGMPNPDWYTETPYGEQACYNVMVRTEGDLWEPKVEFCVYMSKRAQKGSVRLEGNSGDFIQITKEKAA